MITFLGDIWLSDCEFVLPEFQKSSYVLANLEASFDVGNSYEKRNLGPSLFVRPCALKRLKLTGVTHVSICNNHVFDGGETGYIELVKACEQAGLIVVGNRESWAIDLDEYHILFVMEEFQLCWSSEVFAKEQYLFSIELENYIEKNSQKRIILYTHHGIEGFYDVLNVYRNRFRQLVDLGVELVIGNGSHIPQSIEIYKDRRVINSLGNFYFSFLHKKFPIGFSVVLDSNGVSWNQEFLSRVESEFKAKNYKEFVKKAYNENVLKPVVGSLTLAYTKQKLRRFIFLSRFKSIQKADALVRNMVMNDAQLFLIREYERLFNSL